MQHKLVFIETTDVVETTLALDNFRRACDCGRGAVFFSVARGKVAEVGQPMQSTQNEIARLCARPGGLLFSVAHGRLPTWVQYCEST